MLPPLQQQKTRKCITEKKTEPCSLGTTSNRELSFALAGAQY